jgi:tryptophan synthase alpha chain
MNRIDKLFREKGGDILSVYFTAGYPKLEDTVPIISELSAQGVDLIEIGIPFSDPMADGPVIQHSSTQALGNGLTIKWLFAKLQGVREKTAIPLILMGYLNPIMQYGIENFCRDCARAGIDGLIVPDLPLTDYERDFKPQLEKYGLHGILLITPETSEERVRQIDTTTGGFIYMVSTASTTGAKARFDDKTLDYFARIDAMGLKNPRLVGFGISNRETFASACQHAAGGIVGSLFVKLLGEKGVGQAVGELIRRVR